MTLTHLQLLSVPVSDQDRAKAFYVDVLGFDLVADLSMGPDQRWVQVAPLGAATSLTLVTWFDSMPAGSLKGLVIETDDLEGDLKLLADRGLTVEMEIENQPWGRYVTFDDPDGNSLILQTTTFSA